MSFNLLLQRTGDEPNKVVKTISTLYTLTGELKAETSILNPVILINADISNLTDCNYMSIPAFARKYFVTDIRSIRNGLVEISGRVDVLTTYQTQILAQRAIIRRQEQEWNLYLNDGVFKVYQNPEIVTKAFPSGFSTQEIIIAVAGG